LPNDISKEKCDALSIGIEMMSSLLQERQYFTTLSAKAKKYEFLMENKNIDMRNWSTCI
jgi:hypothetical protein